MPMDFPNMESLKARAIQREFRQPFDNESEANYREAFANFMRSKDLVESMEIRYSKGWDQLKPEEMIFKSLFN